MMNNEREQQSEFVLITIMKKGAKFVFKSQKSLYTNSRAVMADLHNLKRKRDYNCSDCPIKFPQGQFYSWRDLDPVLWSVK